eukprot:TRINITY_DN39593_c0_g1_i1.p1 TRINITY_DN39593_c0_g1~~TRINITY_DN39593_c0_g1_i1.p1  ORF type:complete len:189 (+),score=35.56 TRINITY_DN39593_c0_g1_i1:147-713(+)
MAANFMPNVPPIAAGQEIVPTIQLRDTATPRSFGRMGRLLLNPGGTSNPSVTASPRPSLKAKGLEYALPKVHPLAGKQGIINPGCQYGSPCHDTGSYAQEALVTTTARSLLLPARREASATKDVTRSAPVADRSYPNGTGYCPNAFMKVDWSYKGNDDTFKTTYSEMIDTGFCADRALTAATGPRRKR